MKKPANESKENYLDQLSDATSDVMVTPRGDIDPNLMLKSIDLAEKQEKMLQSGNSTRMSSEAPLKISSGYANSHMSGAFGNRNKARRYSNQIHDNVLGIQYSNQNILDSSSALKEQEEDEDEEEEKYENEKLSKVTSKVNVEDTNSLFSIYKIMALMYQWGMINSLLNLCTFLVIVHP